MLHEDTSKWKSIIDIGGKIVKDPMKEFKQDSVFVAIPIKIVAFGA